MNPFTGSAAGHRLAALAVAMLLAGSTPSAAPLSGGPFTILGSTGGGGLSVGGAYTVQGWVASSGAGTSSGGEFDLTCGVVGAYAASADNARLMVEFTGDGRVRMWWSPELVGYQLESTAALGSGGSWQAVQPAPAGSSYFAEPDGPARYYRLRRP